MRAAEVEREARAALDRGDDAEACRRLEALLHEQPAAYPQRCLLGFIHQQAGRLGEARAAYEAARAIAPPSPELQQNLGQVYLRLGEAGLAVQAYEAALRLAPEAPELLDALAAAHQAAGDLPGALACYERILQRDPRHVPAFVGMAEAFADHGWVDDARRSLETALTLAPDHLPALNLMGVLHLRAGRYTEAACCFERAVAARPGDAGLLRNLAMTRAAQGEHAACGALCDAALALAPDDPDVHFTRASHLLLVGRLDEGWREYEYRWASRERASAVKPPPTRLPRWSGEPIPRAGSALLVYSEQGFGDALQFVRYLPLAAARFERVGLVVKPQLRALFARSFAGCAEVFEAPPDESDWTHHCPLMSLPLAFETTLATIPAQVPYLQPDPAAVRAWRTRLAALPGLKVGVNWTTGKRAVHKQSFELSLRDLAPLFALSGVAWISLSKEPLAPADAALLAASGVHDWRDELADFDATAALVAGLDLVISVDTAVAHLAGALARPTWLLNRAESEWRWLLEREDSPWYPTMRLFRQRVPRQWDVPVEAVHAALRARLAEGTA